MMSQSTIYLIPAPLFELEVQAIPQEVQQLAVQIRHYFVENIRTARRVLKAYDKLVDIDQINFELVNNKEAVNTKIFKEWVAGGYDIGIMSEAGMPAFADPGNVLVSIAHEMGAKVVPCTGPSSLMLALVASGLNGQQFSFHGYLPIEKSERVQAFKQMEKSMIQQGCTHIFIETPYRNTQMLSAMVQHFPGTTRICVACDITAPSQFILTQTVSQWSKNMASYDLHKKPCIFLIGM